MKGKWAAGIPPRNFTWVIKDHLAVSERPGGFSNNHRRVRRQEEIIWLRVQGFGRVVSLLPSPHNLAAYDDEGLAWAHYPLERSGDPRPVLAACYQDIDDSLAAGLRILVHQDELGDRVMGVLAGYLVWSKRIANQPQAVALVEHVVGHAMGEPGRELLVRAGGHAGAPAGPVSDRIEIHDLRVTGVHGVLPEEQERAQPFSVDIVAWVDMEAAQQQRRPGRHGRLRRPGPDGGRRRGRALLPPARGPRRPLGRRAADRRPPPRGGRGHGAQAAAAAGPRRGLDRGQGAALPLMAPAGGRTPRRAFIGLGSNLGDRRALLRAAVEGLRAAGDVVGVSPLYETEPVGGPEGQGPYLNLVVELSTADTPRGCSSAAAPSRRRPVGCARCTGARAPSMPTSCGCEGCAVDEADLTVPHPRLWERRFVVQPLADLAPDLVTSEQLEGALVGTVVRVGSL